MYTTYYVGVGGYPYGICCGHFGDGAWMAWENHAAADVAVARGANDVAGLAKD